MVDWPELLVNDLARRRCIIVIGSGVSRHAVGANGARPPVWREFLSEALDNVPGAASFQHIKQAIESGDLLHACEWLKKRYDEDWRRFLRAKFSDPVYSAGKIHEIIIRLDSRVVFSLNFDNIYEGAAGAIGGNAYHVKHYYHTDVCEFLRGDSRYIVKVHGSLDSPDNMIFTQRDYARARSAHSAFYSAFDAALLTHTFFFIGCGHSDPDVNLLLENQAFGFPGNASSPHYFLTARGMSDDLSDSLRKNRNLKIIPYDPDDDSHSGIIPELEGLLDEVEVRREQLTRTTNW